LNLAGLLLWLNWRASGFDPLPGPLRPRWPARSGGPAKRPQAMAFPRHDWAAGDRARLVLLADRFGRGVDGRFEPGRHLRPVRSDRLGRILFFSTLSFALTLATFYLWLVLLSLLNPDTAESEPMNKLVRQHLSPIDRWPSWSRPSCRCLRACSPGGC